MNKISKNNESEIDVVLIFRKVWKEKVLILSTAIIFMFLGFLYESYEEKKYEILYKTEITTKSPPPQKFLPYQKFYASLVPLEETFQNSLTSRDNIQEFVDQNNRIDNFKFYLKKKKLSARDYFQEQFANIKKLKESPEFQRQEFYLILPGKKESNIFLNDYVEYTKVKLLKIYIQDMKLQIETEMSTYKENLEIAKKIELKKPLILVLMSIPKGNSVVNEPTSLYYKGAQVLSLQLSYIQNLYQELSFDNLNYEAILDKASTQEFDVQAKGSPPLKGFILGLLLFLLIIF